MSLFSNENPQLGLSTTVQESSGNGAGQPTVAAVKPITRVFVERGMDLTVNATQTTGWLFCAPFNCKIVRVTFVCTTKESSSTTLQLYTVPVASQPEAPSSGNTVLAAALNVDTGVTANTVASPALSATATHLSMASGDLLGYNLSAAMVALVGGNLQIELQQV
jgi:hypothetical protein